MLLEWHSGGEGMAGGKLNRTQGGSGALEVNAQAQLCDSFQLNLRVDRRGRGGRESF